jgi:hypothetical protein
MVDWEDIGRLALNIGLAIVGSYFGGIYFGPMGQAFLTGLGFMAGSVIGSMIFPAAGGSPDMPQMGNYPVQVAQKGNPTPIVFGTVRVAGNIVWMGDIRVRTIKHKIGESGGGLFGGGDDIYFTETRYHRSFLIAVCEGPATIISALKGKEDEPLTEFTWLDGNGSDASVHTDEDFSVYPNLACAFFDDYDLGNTQAIPNFVFEVKAYETGASSDKNFAEMVKELITNERFGIGMTTDDYNLTNFTAAITHCNDNSLLGSLVLNESRSLWDWIDFICSHFSGYRYWSQGKLNIGIFKNDAAVATLDQDDLVVEETEPPTPPVQVKKRKYTETFNQIEVLWVNRDKAYDQSVAVANDEVDQRISGQIRKATINMTGITDGDFAVAMAYRFLIDSMYRHSFFSFVVSFQNMLLEVGDVITLSDGQLLTSVRMRITSIGEDRDGRGIQIEAVDDISGLYPSIAFHTQDTEHVPDPEITVLDSTVYFREDENESVLHLSIVPGDQYANGWFIYRSYDNSEFVFVGRTLIADVTGDANCDGTIASNLPAWPAVCRRGAESFLVNVGTDIDLDSTITDALFYNNRKLARVGDEIIAYKTCVETAVPGVWRITDLIRGLFGTDAAAHSSGDAFNTLNIDFSYDYSADDIGQLLYFKAVTFYGSNVQDSDVVGSFSHRVKGNYIRPMGASLIRLQADENDIDDPDYSGGSFTLYWNLPGARGTGWNQGGIDIHPSAPVWRWGDSELLLIPSNGVPFGNYIADSELQAIDLVFETTGGTFIGEKTLTATDESESISKADDLVGNDPAVVKVIPRRTMRSIAEHEITVDEV